MAWHSVDDAKKLLTQSAAGSGRDRDLHMLGIATRMCLSPYRRVLEMVRELHRMGYEQLESVLLRIRDGFVEMPRGPGKLDFPRAWRAVPVPDNLDGNLSFPGGSELRNTYSSANGPGELFKGFFVPEIELATPRQLAEAFVVQRPLIAFAGRGPDPEYVRWFELTLDQLWPIGVYYAFAEYQPVFDGLYTVHSEVARVSLPPPGHVSKKDWDSYSMSQEFPGE